MILDWNRPQQPGNAGFVWIGMAFAPGAVPAFVPGGWPTVYARAQDRTVRVPEMQRTVKVEAQDRTISDPRMGGPPL